MNHLLKIPDIFDFWQSPMRNAWVKKTVVAAVLLFASVIAILGTETLLIRVFIAIVGGCGVVVLLQWPSLGILAILMGAFFIPYIGPGGLNAAVIMVGLMSGVWFIDMFVRQKKLLLTHSKTSIAILVFILSALLSFLIGQLPWFSVVRHAPITAQLGGLAIFALSGFAFLIVANLIKDIRWLKAFTIIFLFIAVLYISGRLFPPWGSMLRVIFQPGAATGSMFWIWMLVIPFSQALLNTKLPLVVRAALMVFVGLSLYVSVIQASDWKSGYLPPLAGAAFIVVMLLGRRVLWFIPIGIALVIYVATQSIESETYSWFTRVEAWKIVLQLSLVNPIFGLGFGNYYFYTPLQAINGWHVNFNSHSQFIDIIAQTGLFGLVAFAWVFWEIGKLGWGLRDRLPGGFTRAYVYGALGGLVGMLVAAALVDWVLPFVYNIGMAGFRSSVIGWMFLGGLVVIHRLVDTQGRSQNNVSTMGGQNG